MNYCIHPFCDYKNEKKENLWEHMIQYNEHNKLYKNKEQFIQCMK